MRAVICTCALIIGVTLGVGNESAPWDGPSDEQRVLDHLLESLSSDVRSVRHAATAPPTIVYINLYLINILDLDAKMQELTMNIWLDLHWNTDFRWNPSEYGGLKTVTVPIEQIWFPDIILYNNADDPRGEVDYSRFRALFSSDGYVVWQMPMQIKSTCNINVKYFPFDSQHCHLRFGSWAYTGAQVDVRNLTSSVDLRHYVVSGEYNLVTAHQKRRAKAYVEFDAPFPEMIYYLHLRRYTLYYLYTTIIPCLLISALTLLVFCLPPDSSDKISLCVAVLLTFSVFLIAVGEKLPQTSESIPLIGIYLTIIMGMSSVSVVMAVVLIRTDNAAQSNRRLPPFLQWLILGKIRKLLCMNLSHRRSHNRRSVESGLELEEAKLHARSGGGGDAGIEAGEENDWIKAARVLDRLLFWAFVVATVGFTLLLLVVIPAAARVPAVPSEDQLDDSLYGVN